MAKIDSEKCTGCKKCLIFCPDNAIVYDGGKCSVDQGICTECYVCLNHPICPQSAFLPADLSDYKKLFQHSIGDPTTTESSIKRGPTGRGGQEVKRVDVVKSLQDGQLNITIDVGRPGLGVYLRDAEKVTRAMIGAGAVIPVSETSPIARILANPATGEYLPEYRDLHMHSFLIEAVIPEDKLAGFVTAMQKVGGEIDTVFTVGLVARVDVNCWNKALDALDTINFPRPHRGKVNVGLGRPYPPKLAED